MYSRTLLLLFAAFSSVNALATPHLRSAHHHRAIAARVAAPTPQHDLPLLTPKKRDLRRRSLSKRCKTRPAPSSSIVSSSAAASSSAAPVNVASAPPTFSSSSTQAQETSTKEATTFTPTSTQVTTFTPTTTSTPTSTFTPTTSSSSEAPATTSEAPATTSSTSSSSSSGSESWLSGTQSGQGTFYETGLGSCGITNTDSDFIAAVSHTLYDNYPGYNGVNPNSNPVCGKKVTAHYQGKSVTVTITDRCTGCQVTDLDFSPAAFTQLADESLGRIDITWDWD